MTKPTYQAVLLDVDGTLFSSEEMLLEVYHRAMQDFRHRHGRPEHLPDLAAIMEQIGQPVKKIFQNLVPELTEEERDEISQQILVDLVRRIDGGDGVHYDGVAATLQRLHESGVKIYAASNGRRAYVEAILRAAGIDSLFDAVPAIDNVTIFNKSELVAHVLSKYGHAASECVIVGDRATDRDAGRENGVPFVACTYGHGREEEYRGAVARIASFPELLGVLGLSEGA